MPEPAPHPPPHPCLFVVGGVALDTLHVGGRQARAAGGAGLYTALAAVRAGARVQLLAPRPRPMPPELEPADRLLDWRGPAVAPAELPAFEIAYRADGGVEMLAARPGRADWPAATDVPEALDGELVFVAALPDPRRQLELVGELLERGCRVATGVHPCAVDGPRETVRELFERADIFFCNAAEAAALFGGLDGAVTTPARLLFVTLGGRGARVARGANAADVPAVPADVVDPTGAGDAFAGVTLAWLLQGRDPVAAARRGVATASEVVRAVGPGALLTAAAARHTRRADPSA